MLTLDIQRDSQEDSPADALLRRAADAAVEAAALPDTDREISLRIVDGDEMRGLNARYRGRDYATNVLSFPAQLPADLGLPLLGDIAICAPVVRREARDQGKALAAHWDHMLVHGVLHLLGYDHEADDDAHAMESVERRALAALGWPDPYAETPAPTAREASGA